MLIALFRTFLVFFVGGLLMTTAVISLFLIGGIVWLDCLHDNPNHTCGDALFFVAVSPFYGYHNRDLGQFPAPYGGSCIGRPWSGGFPLCAPLVFDDNPGCLRAGL